MNIIVTLLMIALGGALIFLLIQKKSDNKGLIVLCAIVLILLSVGRIVKFDSDPTQKIMEVQRHYEEVYGQVVGDYIAENFPTSRVVLLTTPVINREIADVAPLAVQLERILKGRLASLTVESLPMPENMGNMFMEGPDGESDASMDMMAMEGAMWMGSDHLAASLANYKDKADLVVCTFPIMMMNSAEVLPSSDEKPAVLLCYADEENLSEAFNQSNLEAGVVYRSNPEAWSPDAKIPEDANEAFNRRYRLITRNDQI